MLPFWEHAKRDMSMRTCKLIAILSVLMVSGCAGPNTNELLTEAPTLTFTTTASMEEARNCFTALDPAHYIATPRDKGWLIINTQQGFQEQAFFAVTINPSPRGSLIEYRRGHSPIVGSMPDLVKPCLDKLPR